MALASSRRQRTIALCALYFAQGVPWGFMLLALPSYLAYNYASDFGTAEIGNLKAIILVPWSFKLIWAPIMDSFTIRSMGRRRPWIIGAEFMMAATLLGFVGLGDLSDKLQYLIAMYFLHNCFASLQDVCTDALAVDILPPEEQGQMNGLMWGSKLVGKGAGAWGLAVVLKEWGLEGCVVVQVALLLVILLVPIFFLERAGEKRFPWSRSRTAGRDGAAAKSPMKTCAMCGAELELNAPQCPGCGAAFEPAGPAVVRNVSDPRQVIRSVLRAFSVTTLWVYVIFTLLKLIGSGVNEVLTNTLYTQQLDPKWTDTEFSTVSGLYTMPPIIFGAWFGGFLADRFGRRVILAAGFGGYGIAAMIFAGFPELWNNRQFAIGYVLAYESLNAVASVGFLSMAMRISWTKSAATVFTVYMTLSNVSHIVGNKLAGPVREMFTFAENGEAAALISYELSFWFVGAVSMAPLLLLFWVRPAEVDRAAASPD